MIGYVTIGTNNLLKSGAFYEALLSEMKAEKAFQTDDLIAWKFADSNTMLMLTKPYDKNASTVGNGVMVALAVSDQASIDALHAKALGLGATNEGDPGPRGKNFYAAYFRDLDGNKLNFFCYQ